MICVITGNKYKLKNYSTYKLETGWSLISFLFRDFSFYNQLLPSNHGCYGKQLLKTVVAIETKWNLKVTFSWKMGFKSFTVNYSI